MKPKSVLLLAGTHGWGWSSAKQWWEHDSPFAQFLIARGHSIIGGDRPFVWNTNLDGVGWIHSHSKRHLNWESAGFNLHAYLRNPLTTEDYIKVVDRNIIAHSHGLQVVLYACASGLIINRLITVSSPVREDMRAVCDAARPNIGYWRHVHSDDGDRIQWFGTIFDGKIRIIREHYAADENIFIPRVAHSKLLNEPEQFRHWPGLLAGL